MFIKILIGIVAISVFVVIALLILMFTNPDFFSKNKQNGEVVSADMNNKPAQNSKIFTSGQLADSKDFVPVKSFEDFALDLGNHNYRAIVEVSSIMYPLMSPIEQRMVRVSYQNFLNSIKFPIEEYVQSRVCDIDSICESLKERVNKASKRFNQVSNYADMYINSLYTLPQYTNNAREKRKYIIVEFNNSDLSDVSELTNYEIKQFALEEIYNRCRIVASGMMGIKGVKATVLDKSKIAEVLFSYYHRQYYRLANDIAMGMYNSLAVVDRDFEYGITDREKLDSILSSAQERIKTELVTADCSSEVLAFYRQIYSMLEYCKQDDRSAYIGDLLRNTEQEAYNNGYAQEYYDYAINNQDKMMYTNFDSPDDTNNISIRYAPDDYSNNAVGENLYEGINTSYEYPVNGGNGQTSILTNNMM